MRLRPTQLEELAPAPFIVIVGLAGGVLQGIPRFFLGNGSNAEARSAQLVVVGAFSLLWWAGAFLLWWAAVRRRRFSVWKTAWHLTLALSLAQLLDLALGLVVASIETNGAIVTALIHAPLSASSSSLVLVLILGPIRFLGSALLVAFGRQLPERGSPTAPRPLTSTDPEAVA
jgi:hypothetical protein